MEVVEQPLTVLAEHSRIPIAFTVTRVLDVREHEGVLSLDEHDIEVPYVKDYDAIQGNHPSDWVPQFNTSNWGLLVAYLDDTRVGGAVIAFDTPGLELLEDRSDLAVLWDLRIALGFRRKGVGTALFRAAEEWAVSHNCCGLKVETQNINVPACRFYERQGCVLRNVRRDAYPGLPDEVQLIWFKDLRRH